jgi:transposase
LFGDGLKMLVRQISRADARVRLLMSTPGVGPLVALTYVGAIDDPARFTSSKSVGAHFGRGRANGAAAHRRQHR